MLIFYNDSARRRGDARSRSRGSCSPPAAREAFAVPLKVSADYKASASGCGGARPPERVFSVRSRARVLFLAGAQRAAAIVLREIAAALWAIILAKRELQTLLKGSSCNGGLHNKRRTMSQSPTALPGKTLTPYGSRSLRRACPPPPKGGRF